MHKPVFTTAKLIVFLLAFLLCVLLTLFGESNPYTAPVAKKGQLHLDESFSSASLYLEGEWEFYWDTLLISDPDPDAVPDLYATVPSGWNGYLVDGQPLGHTGRASYRLVVDGFAESADDLEAFTQLLNIPHRIYINGRCVQGHGRIGADGYSNTSDYFPGVWGRIENGAIEVVIEIANIDALYGGLTRPPVLSMYWPDAEQDGPAYTVVERSIFVLSGTLSLLFLLLFCAITYGFSQKTNLALLFFLLSISLYLAIPYLETLDTRLGSKITAVYLPETLILLILLALINLMARLFPQNLTRGWQLALSIPVALYLPVTLLVPTGSHIGVTWGALFLSAAVFVAMAAALAFAIWQRKPYAFLMGLALLSFGVAFLYEKQFLLGFYYRYPLLFFWGAAAFSLFYAGIQATRYRQFARAAKQVAELQAEVQRRDMEYLTGQIKPHFLFNALNTVVSYCVIDPARAEELLRDLSIFLRDRLDTGNEKHLVSAIQELEMTEAYLQIEKARFGNRLRVDFQIDQTVSAQLPFLSIQPLVENAVKHGFTSGRPLSVTVSIEKRDGGVQILVRDDGAGIPAEKLQDFTANPGIGLWNVNRRLSLYCNSALQIESVPGQGTSAGFLLPEVVR